MPYPNLAAEQHKCVQQSLILARYLGRQCAVLTSGQLFRRQPAVFFDGESDCFARRTKVLVWLGRLWRNR